MSVIARCRCIDVVLSESSRSTTCSTTHTHEIIWIMVIMRVHNFVHVNLGGCENDPQWTLWGM